MALRLVVVGGGKMGGALVAGLLEGGWAEAGEIAVVEPDADRRAELEKDHPGLVVGPEVPAGDGAVLAVKPSEIGVACAAVANAGIPRVLSIAAGVTLATLEAHLGAGPRGPNAVAGPRGPNAVAGLRGPNAVTGLRGPNAVTGLRGPNAVTGVARVAVVRAMPNTPALVGCGAAAISGGSAAGDADLAWAEEILSAVGLVVRVPEHLLDAVTGLSGSGPAYIFLVAEALVEAGVLNGLPVAVSRDLVVQTILGSARLLAASDQDAAALRAAVTSPGGTTAAGVRALERAAVRSALLEAVTAATERSRQLGRP